MAEIVLKNSTRALEIGSTVATVFAYRSPEAALLSLPQVINFYHTGKGLYLGKTV